MHPPHHYRSQEGVAECAALTYDGVTDTTVEPFLLAAYNTVYNIDFEVDFDSFCCAEPHGVFLTDLPHSRVHTDSSLSVLSQVQLGL